MRVEHLELLGDEARLLRLRRRRRRRLLLLRRPLLLELLHVAPPRVGSLRASLEVLVHLRVQETNSLLVAPRALSRRARAAPSFFRRSSSYIASNAIFSRSSACFSAALRATCSPRPASAFASTACESPWRTPSHPARHCRYSCCSANCARSAALGDERARARATSASLRSSGVTWFATSSACSARSSSKSMDASFSRRASRVASARAFRASNLVSGAKGDASVVSQRFPRALDTRGSGRDVRDASTEPRGRHARAPLFELVLRDHLVGVVPLRVQVADVTRLVQSSAAGRNWTRVSAFAREGSRSRRARF